MSRYRSHADLGGQRGHGPVTGIGDEALFHAEWEKRALALTLAAGATGEWNIDESRSARETLADYASLSYYRIWLRALETLLVERGLVRADEIDAGRALHPTRGVARVLSAAHVAGALARGSPTLRAAPSPPRYAVGQRVRTYAGEVPHHTRLPGYAKGRLGRVERVHGAHVFADAHALGRGEDSRWLYTVLLEGDSDEKGERDDRSDGERGAQSGDFDVSIDAWEPYLEAAS